ncbi:MAG: G5 domain-containing protein [Oscillospiraceae bacterium]|jgi:uncharacterized protein YabE (DUF348 family)/3D (Asp-Asp-Asp) domain-containing protein|nr:G5 domain-containing protein [Oscillospiraceae bacterium]
MTEKGQKHRRRIIITAVVIAALLVGSATITAYAMSARTVIIRDDDQTQTLTTTREDAIEILQARNIALGNDDFLDLGEFSAESDCIIRIYRAKEIILEDGENVRRLRAAGTVQRLLQLNEVVLKERDTLNCMRTDLLVDGMHIVVSRAFDIAVLDGGKSQSVTLTEGTVAEALAECKLALAGDDYVEPAPLTPLEPGMTIHVNRVAYRERKTESAIDFAKISKKSASLDLGKTKIEQAGVKGKLETLYQDKYINGKKVESIQLKETVLQKPVAEIKLVGTKAAKLRAGAIPISELAQPASLRVDGSGIPSNYREVIVGTAKAYAGDPTTAVGIKPKPGYIAVDPEQIPYGSQLWIVSNDGKYVYGYAVAADTGGFVKKQSCTVDLFMNSESECNQWGHRGVTIYVLDLPPVKF